MARTARIPSSTMWTKDIMFYIVQIKDGNNVIHEENVKVITSHTAVQILRRLV